MPTTKFGLSELVEQVNDYLGNGFSLCEPNAIEAILDVVENDDVETELNVLMGRLPGKASYKILELHGPGGGNPMVQFRFEDQALAATLLFLRWYDDSFKAKL